MDCPPLNCLTDTRQAKSGTLRARDSPAELRGVDGERAGDLFGSGKSLLAVDHATDLIAPTGGFRLGRIERQFHALVRRHETEALVEAMRIRPALVGRELHQRTTFRPRECDRRDENLVAEAFAAMRGGDPHRLDLRPACALAAQTRG